MSTNSKVGEILVQPDELAHRVRELAAEISADYAGREVLLIGVLEGAVFFLADLMRPLEVDCGLTLSYLCRMLGARSPASLEVCALLTKPERREVDMPIRYVGFEIPNRFAIGYGLDHAERYRNLPYVAVLNEP